MNQLQSSRIDFNTKCDNSSRLHIVVIPVGHIDEDFLTKVPTELGKVPLPNQSQLNARFVLQSQPLLSDWSDVQYYRRPIGLLCVSHADSGSNISAILPQYEKIKRRMETSVIDSRCIVFSQEPVTLPPDLIRPDIMVIQYAENVESIHCEALTALIGEFTQALFSVIVRNSIEMAGEKYTPQLLYSPFERSKSGLDDGKMGRKRVQARHKKHLGDLYLIIGKPEKAIDAYDESIKSLLSLGDSLWVGVALEGQACAIFRLMQLEEAESISLAKNDKLRSSQESLNSISSEPEMRSAENLIRLFRGSIGHMEKIREASLIMLECTLKFIRLTIDLDHKREACAILNSEIFYCYEDLNAVEKLQFFCTIAILYEQMGMHRKYSYYLRRAALESIHEKMLSRAYTISSSLLCNVIEMYGVVPGRKSVFGWPQLQKLVLDDLISTSDKLANSDIVVKYGMCLLQSFYHHLDYDDQLRILNLISKNNTRMGDHVIEVPNVPICKHVDIKPLGKSLHPQVAKQTSSIFIFNPNNDKNTNQAVTWVCDEFGEVSVKLENPLLHVIQLLDVRCIVTGEEAECFPSMIAIPPRQTAEVVLAVKPMKPGKLTLTGIKFQLFGVPSVFTISSARMISVIKPMPLLILKSVIPPTLSLYEGEVKSLSCKLSNNSRFPIKHLNVMNSCSRDRIFEHSDIPLPIMPGAVVDFRIDVSTFIEHERREVCLKRNQSVRKRRGTIYENSSEETSDGDDQVISCRKSSKADNMFVEEQFSVCLQYYDEEKEFFRNSVIEFSTQINLLFNLVNYAIVPHPSDSNKCQWHLNISSLCPQRLQLNIAGDTKFLDPGYGLKSVVDIDREPSIIDGIYKCHCRVKHSDLINPHCRKISWSVGKRRGSVNVIESAPQTTDLLSAFKEEVILSCTVQNFKQRDENNFQIVVGTPVTITAIMTNDSNQMIESVLLYVRPYEDGAIQARKLAEIPFIGTRDFTSDILDAGASVTHSLSMLPMVCGNFIVEIGACLIPEVSEDQHCILPLYDSSSDIGGTEAPFLEKEILMQHLNDGLSPPKNVKNWKMRPPLFFEVCKG